MAYGIPPKTKDLKRKRRCLGADLCIIGQMKDILPFTNNIMTDNVQAVIWQYFINKPIDLHIHTLSNFY